MIENKILELAQTRKTPFYVYDLGAIKNQCEILKNAFKGVVLQYACKANINQGVLRTIYSKGFFIETVSPGEISACEHIGIPSEKITYTCCGADDDEIIRVFKKNIRVHLDSLSQVETIGKKFPGSEISVRLNLGIGAGHHAHTITGGKNSKFGIPIEQLSGLLEIADKYKLKITGIHQHIGSGILDTSLFVAAFRKIFSVAKQLKNVSHIDCGGGFGVPYKPGEKPLNVEYLGKQLEKIRSEFEETSGRTVQVSIEPGRFLVAQAGYLLVEVTDIKHNDNNIFVDVNSGMNHLVRPAVYDAYHTIKNTSNKRGRKVKVNIVGNICESGDYFAKERYISLPKKGDVFCIYDVGAYGYSMSSEYNSREKPEEITI